MDEKKEHIERGSKYEMIYTAFSEWNPRASDNLIKYIFGRRSEKCMHVPT